MIGYEVEEQELNIRDLNEWMLYSLCNGTSLWSLVTSEQGSVENRDNTGKRTIIEKEMQNKYKEE